MQIFTVFALITTACVSSASAKCFQTGQNWGDHAVAKSRLDDACKTMQGRYAQGEVFSQCRNGQDFRSFKFEIQNNNDHEVHISHYQCVTTISREIDNCGHGGQETFDHVRYRYVNKLILSTLLLLTISGVIPTKVSVKDCVERIDKGDRMREGASGEERDGQATHR